MWYFVATTLIVSITDTTRGLQCGTLWYFVLTTLVQCLSVIAQEACSVVLCATTLIMAITDTTRGPQHNGKAIARTVGCIV